MGGHFVWPFAVKHCVRRQSGNDVFGVVITGWRIFTFRYQRSWRTALVTRQQLADIFGDDIANADQTPQGQLAGLIAVLEAVIGEALVRN